MIILFCSSTVGKHEKRRMACEFSLLIGTSQRIPRLLKRFATWSTIPEAQPAVPQTLHRPGKLPEPRPENGSIAATVLHHQTLGS